MLGINGTIRTVGTKDRKSDRKTAGLKRNDDHKNGCALAEIGNLGMIYALYVNIWFLNTEFTEIPRHFMRFVFKMIQKETPNSKIQKIIHGKKY
jgi:hypothetical protein